MSAWRKNIEATVSLREAHRALKIWRALWKVARPGAAALPARGVVPQLLVRGLTGAVIFLADKVELCIISECDCKIGKPRGPTAELP
jgi:hypothetical protein